MALVFVLALAARVAFALPQAQPGYMDAYYYTADAQQLATGHGFVEPFIWNYLDDPQGLPQLSHQYWMPLPSILAALSMRVLGVNFRAAQVPFVLLAALLPVIAYAIAWQACAKRRPAWAAALFAVFSGFFVSFWSVPETFAPFAVFGSLSVWAAGRGGRWGFVAGLCAGLAHLTRADGVLLLLPALLLLGMNHDTITRRALNGLWVVVGYALVMSPWLIHNWAATGRLLSTAGSQTLFLTNYDDLYNFGKTLDLRTYLAWGAGNILRSKLDGLWANLLTLVAVDGLIFLSPFAVVGFWQRRRDRTFLAAIIYGGALYLAMSLAFTFPGVRGGLFHSSAALLPFIFASAMVGLDATIDWVSARRAAWNAALARRVFTWGLVVYAILLSGSIYWTRVRGWNQADGVYDAIGARLRSQPSAIVMVNNPPGYFYHTGQRAIVVPNGDVDTLMAAARQYGATWVVLDANRPAALTGLYEQPRSDPRLELLETFEADTDKPVYLLQVKDEARSNAEGSTCGCSK
jgi:4-amino-4-deoxy-L-arabinose transferase-like glycosyltransferase